MERVYKFNRQLKRGEAFEVMLDAMYQDEYIIEPANADEQRRGIDRWFTHRVSGRRVSVQYKADERFTDTGNIFIETISVDTTNKPGCILTCEAFSLFFFLPQRARVLIFRPRTLRGAIEMWKDIYPVKQSQNETYQTHGICVPLEEMEGCAVAQHQFYREKVA